MKDLIYRDELIKALNEKAMEHHESHIPMVEHDFRELIHDAPAAEPIIRCKDCKYYEPSKMLPVHPMLGGGTVVQNVCTYSTRVLTGDDYCSKGEKKDE